MLNEEQYYQFFLSVLDVYGFAVVDMHNGILKVVRSKDAKTSAVPVASDASPGLVMRLSPGWSPSVTWQPGRPPAASAQ